MDTLLNLTLLLLAPLMISGGVLSWKAHDDDGESAARARGEAAETRRRRTYARAS